MKLRFLQVRPSIKLILLLGLLNGLLYVFLVPPWEHYDEPGHFEYAWLVANRPGLPKPGDYDQSMHRAVALSMIEHNFFNRRDMTPDLNVQNEPIWIGIPQIDSQPLYYLLASLPLRLLTSADITLQLYAGRLVSLVLFLVSLIAAWGFMKELVPNGHPLRWMVPISMVFLPGYVDIMTAVNNDVGAAVLFSLFLWGSVRMFRQGFSFWGLLWTSGAAILCFWTKDTVLFAIPLEALLLVLVIFRRRWCWAPWVGLIATVPIIMFSVFSWGDALYWIRSPKNWQERPTQALYPKAPIGEYVLQMEPAAIKSSYGALQLVSVDQASTLRGKPVTLGAWVWASEPFYGRTLILFDGKSYFSDVVELTTSPTFFDLTVNLAEDASRIQVILGPGNLQDHENLTVFFDGLVLTEGTYPQDSIPMFKDPAAQQGMWAGKDFVNLLRNASGERDGPGIRPWVAKLNSTISSTIPSASLVLGSILDLPGSSWYYQRTAQNLLRTFWGRFGWNEVSLSLPFISQPYIILTIFTLAGIIGAVLVLIRRRSHVPWYILLFLAVGLAGVWGGTILRGIPSLTGYAIFIPYSRYAFPVIIPTMLILNAGWLEIGLIVERWTHLAHWGKSLVYILLLLSLDVAAIMTIVNYYAIR